MQDAVAVCRSKHRFATRKFAKHVAKKTHAKRRLHVYQCAVCACYHLTSLPKDVFLATATGRMQYAE